MTEPALPERFQDLAPFLDWALEPERARIEKKAAASMDEIRAFYGAMIPRIDEILDYLDGYFGGDMPAPTHRLYLMSLSLVEVAVLVEIYKRREAVDACDPLRFVPAPVAENRGRRNDDEAVRDVGVERRQSAAPPSQGRENSGRMPD